MHCLRLELQLTLGKPSPLLICFHTFSKSSIKFSPGPQLVRDVAELIITTFMKIILRAAFLFSTSNSSVNVKKIKLLFSAGFSVPAFCELPIYFRPRVLLTHDIMPWLDGLVSCLFTTRPDKDASGLLGF